ncbi:MAG: hypothetical protein JO022_07215, partial [Acidobacteriaceae bacterium]|nr:hypothetical protein [Acidobacteriaceae bacterium]
AGIYKSVDGGQTWSAPTRRAVSVNARDGSYTDMHNTEVWEVEVDPQNPNVVIANFSGGFTQSNDGGVTFFDCLRMGTGAGPASRDPLPVRVVHANGGRINPTFPNVLYVREHATHAAYRSEDGGRRWTRLAIPGGGPVLSIAAHPANAKVVYAAGSSGIFVSQNAGNTWTQLQAGQGPKSTGGFTIPHYFNGTAFNSVATVVHEDEPIVVDPVTDHVLYGSLGVRVLVGVK